MTNSKSIRVISPIDGNVFIERPLASDQNIEQKLTQAQQAFSSWRRLSVEERCAKLNIFVDAMLTHGPEISQELTQQMGRPIRHSPGELNGFAQRAKYMIDIAPEALATIQPPRQEGFTRFIRRNPLGVVFVIAPWNYPFLTAVNTVVPALLAGNTVILKHSAQTPLVAERFSQAANESGMPSGVLSHLHLDHLGVAQIIQDQRIQYVTFTGSVEGGRAIQKAASKRFIGIGLELGGKDPAYVRSDAHLANAIETLVDGTFYNAGQSCCGIERIYVHHDRFLEFVDGFVALTQRYILANPLDENTTLGPVVRLDAAERIQSQIDAAVIKGAKALIDPRQFSYAKKDTCYFAPQVLTHVNHRMEIMKEETFGPVVGIMSVNDDEEAIRLMNDSRYGLTASIFTGDEECAIQIGDRIETGTWFMNRCDYLDPALAWTGVKDSGRGCSLSRVGYEYLTRPQSFHLKTKI